MLNIRQPFEATYGASIKFQANPTFAATVDSFTEDLTKAQPDLEMVRVKTDIGRTIIYVLPSNEGHALQLLVTPENIVVSGDSRRIPFHDWQQRAITIQVLAVRHLVKHHFDWLVHLDASADIKIKYPTNDSHYQIMADRLLRNAPIYNSLLSRDVRDLSIRLMLRDESPRSGFAVSIDSSQTDASRKRIAKDISSAQNPTQQIKWDTITVSCGLAMIDFSDVTSLDDSAIINHHARFVSVFNSLIAPNVFDVLFSEWPTTAAE